MAAGSSTSARAANLGAPVEPGQLGRQPGLAHPTRAEHGHEAFRARAGPPGGLLVGPAQEGQPRPGRSTVGTGSTGRCGGGPRRATTARSRGDRLPSSPTAGDRSSPVSSIIRRRNVVPWRRASRRAAAPARPASGGAGCARGAVRRRPPSSPARPRRPAGRLRGGAPPARRPRPPAARRVPPPLQRRDLRELLERRPPRRVEHGAEQVGRAASAAAIVLASARWSTAVHVALAGLEQQPVPAVATDQPVGARSRCPRRREIWLWRGTLTASVGSSPQIASTRPSADNVSAR